MTQQQQQQPAFFATPAEMVAIAAQQQQSVQQPAFFTTAADLMAVASNRPVELIEDFVPSGSVAVLAGAPGTGKSFVALSWAAAVAEGSEWFGQRVGRQAPVVYVLGEGWGSFGDRLRAWQQVNGRPIPDELYFVNGVPLGVNLSDGDVVQQFIEQMKLVQPGLIILDTFSMLARVSNENDNAEVAAVMANVNTIVQATGATVVLIHHVTKTSGSVRGASAFVGNADTVVMAVREVRDSVERDEFLLSTEARHGGKQRDGMAKALHGFSIASPGVLTQSAHNDVRYRKKVDEAREKAMAAVMARMGNSDEQSNNDEKEN